MRIGFDLDGVLADLHKTFVATAVRLFPELDRAVLASPAAGSSPPMDAGADDPNETLEESPDFPALTRRQSSAVWRALAGETNFWEGLDEIEAGAIQRLAAVAEARKWEVIFLTSRPFAPGRTVQRQSQAWLTRCGFPMPSLFVVQTSRGRIAEALQLDVVVDDRADNCLDVVLESKARAILVWRGTPSGIPASAKRLGIGIVPTVNACLDVLIEADQPASTPTDFMQRLRRLLGLQAKPAATK